MKMDKAIVLKHIAAAGEYRLLTLTVPRVAVRAKPGQFVHLLVPGLDAAVLRRPFSIYRAGGKTISLLFKPVGHGTRSMLRLEAGDAVSVMGPLGKGFPALVRGRLPVLVAGGYGVAPLSFLASRLPRPGLLFVGGRSARDVLCLADFRKLGWKIQVSTEDGTVGSKGFVTAPLDAWTARLKAGVKPELFACGPDGLLKALGARAIRHGWKAWLSLDNHMACGVGACLACVQKIRGADGVEVWGRVCKDGPVFEAREIVWK
jgi:dihydroorotate dehydrogenase electron transfer subunit